MAYRCVEEGGIKMIDNPGMVKMKDGMNGLNTRNMNTFTMTELLFYFALILNLSYSLFYPVYIALHSIYHIIILGIIIAIYVSERFLSLNRNKLFSLMVFFGATVAVIQINHSGLGLVINILWPLTIIYVFKNSNLTTRYLQRINNLMLVGWFVSLVSTFTYNEAYFANFEAGIEVEGVNPNTMAIIIVFTALFLHLYVDSSYKPKLFKVAITLLSFIALYRTRSRTSLIAFVVILLMEFILKKKIKKSSKLGMAIPILIIALGIIFPFVYTYLYAQGIIGYHTLFLGKRIFTGRQYIWLSLWEYLQQHNNAWLWGVGYNTELYSRGTFNMHNAYVAIFAQYGIPLFICYISYILHSFKKMYNKYDNVSDLQFKCYQILIYILIVGFGEGVLSYLPNLLFIAMAIGIGNREKLEGF